MCNHDSHIKLKINDIDYKSECKNSIVDGGLNINEMSKLSSKNIPVNNINDISKYVSIALNRTTKLKNNTNFNAQYVLSTKINLRANQLATDSGNAAS